MSNQLELKRKKLKRGFVLSEWLLEILLVILVIAFAFCAPGFFTVGNILNILRNISFKGVIAFGMTMVIIAGEIDLSVGSMVGLSGVMTALISKNLISAGMGDGAAIAAAITITLVFAFLAGSGISVIITKYNVPSFIMTLAMLNALRGAALLASGGFPIIGYPAWFNKLGSGYIGPIPSPAILFIAVMLIMLFVMNKTPFGRSVYAVGSNKESAKLSGINVNKVKLIIFGSTWTLAAAAGIMISSQLNSGTPMAGQSWETDVISSVIIGGASLSGGAGTIRGTLVGCIFLGVLLNGMTLMNVNDYWQYVVRGLLITGAVLMNTQLRGRIMKLVAKK